jgi:hypothetical protein
LPFVKGGEKLGQYAGVKLDQRKTWKVEEEVGFDVLMEGMASGAEACAGRRV